MLAIHGRGRVQSSAGNARAAAPASEAAEAAAAAAAAAAAGGRGHRPPPGTRWRPVGLHDLILWLEARVVPAPGLSGRRGRGADDTPQTQVLMLDVLHLDALGRVCSVRRPAGLVLLLLWSDSGGTHGHGRLAPLATPELGTGVQNRTTIRWVVVRRKSRKAGSLKKKKLPKKEELTRQEFSKVAPRHICAVR